MAVILLIEDEQSVAKFIIQGLEEEGYTVLHVSDGLTGIETVKSKTVDLILLDILLPKMNGLEVCRKIKDERLSNAPILMLTALGSPENVALGLDSGADDYLGKPFKFVELIARIRNLLRRNEQSHSDENGNHSIYAFADLELNDATKKVKKAGQDVSLTSTEFRLLMTFLRNPNIVLSRLSLLEEVWGINFDMGTNVVDVYVNYLRKKLKQKGGAKLIHTVIGMGYVLREE